MTREKRNDAIARANRGDEQRMRDLVVYHRELEAKNKHIEELEQKLYDTRARLDVAESLNNMSKSVRSAKAALEAMQQVQKAADFALGEIRRWMP